jgi:hypothetical protein
MGMDSSSSSSSSSSHYHTYSCAVIFHRVLQFAQNCVVIAIYLMINSQISSWQNWSLPYDTVLFTSHLICILADVVKMSQFDHTHGDIRIHKHQLAWDRAIATEVLFVDATAVIRQTFDVKNSNTITTNGGIIQLCLLGFLTFVSLTRLVESYFRHCSRHGSRGCCSNGYDHIKEAQNNHSKPKNIPLLAQINYDAATNVRSSSRSTLQSMNCSGLSDSLSANRC